MITSLFSEDPTSDGFSIQSPVTDCHHLNIFISNMMFISAVCAWRRVNLCCTATVNKGKTWQKQRTMSRFYFLPGLWCVTWQLLHQGFIYHEFLIFFSHRWNVTVSNTGRVWNWFIQTDRFELQNWTYKLVIFKPLTQCEVVFLGISFIKCETVYIVCHCRYCTDCDV